MKDGPDIPYPVHGHLSTRPARGGWSSPEAATDVLQRLEGIAEQQGEILDQQAGILRQNAVIIATQADVLAKLEKFEKILDGLSGMLGDPGDDAPGRHAGFPAGLLKLAGLLG